MASNWPLWTLLATSGASYSVVQEEDDDDGVIKMMIMLTRFYLLGSETLSRWRKLATPNLAGVLEQRPGIQVKGQSLTTYCEEEKYSIADYEEDGMFLCFFIVLFWYRIYTEIGGTL